MNQIKLTGKFYLMMVAWSGRKYPICLQFTAFQMSEPRYYLIIGCTNIKFRYDWIYNQANVNVEPPEGLRHGSSAGHRQSIDLDVHNTATRSRCSSRYRGTSTVPNISHINDGTEVNRGESVPITLRLAELNLQLSSRLSRIMVSPQHHPIFWCGYSCAARSGNQH